MLERLIVLPIARRDIIGIERTSRRGFGADAASRYRGLMQRAFFDLRLNPLRIGSGPAPDRNDLLLYPIKFSLIHLPADERVGRPRHIIAYRFGDDWLEINRVYHERMNIAARVRASRRANS